VKGLLSSGIKTNLLKLHHLSIFLLAGTLPAYRKVIEEKGKIKPDPITGGKLERPDREA